MMRLLALLCLSCTACVPDGPLKRPTDGKPAVVAGDWEVATPRQVGLDPDAVREVIDRFGSEDHFRLGRSLLVVKDGRLVVEAYVHPHYGRDELAYLKSASKSVTSLATGIAIDEGAIADVNEPLLPYLGETGSDATFADFLTMRAGLRWDNDTTNFTFLVDEPYDSVAFALAQGFKPGDGAAFHYSDGEPHLVGAAVAAATGEPFEDFVEDRLLRPLGIERHRWATHRDGLPYAAFGLWLRPRDMARLGQLWVDGGRVDGRQVVSSQWLRECFVPRVDNEMAEQDFARGHPYGYYFWLRPERGAVVAEGHGGQFIYTVPEHALVVVVTAAPFSQSEAWVTWDDMNWLVDLLLDGPARGPSDGGR